MTTPTTARSRPRGHPGYSTTFARLPNTVPEARNLARVALATWGLGPGQIQTSALLLSELATNAVVHARGPSIRIIIDRPEARLVYLAVVDRAPRLLPVMRVRGLNAESGRGLLMVDAAADRWGYELLGPKSRPWGKKVWAEVSAA